MRHSDSRAILKERIESELREQRLTIAQLAVKAKVSAGTINGAMDGSGKTTLRNLEKIANALGLSVADLLKDSTEVLSTGKHSVNVFSGLMHNMKDVLEHEERVLNWEKETQFRQMILPFFSVIHQTQEVAIYIRDRGCYNYTPIQESEPADLERFREIIEERRTLVQSSAYKSEEIASEYEVRKFAKGEIEFSGLGPEQRRRQLDSILNVLENQSIPGVEIRLLRHPLYVMLGLYGDNHATLRGRGIFLEINDRTEARRFYANFTELWNRARRGSDLINFLKTLTNEIS